jgi:hypothetical protein
MDRLSSRHLVLAPDSYGAATALMTSLASPGRVRAPAIYEPTLFAVVDAASPPPNGVEGTRRAVRAAAIALDTGDRDAAAEHFIDFWMGGGSWKATRVQR